MKTEEEKRKKKHEYNTKYKKSEKGKIVNKSYYERNKSKIREKAKEKRRQRKEIVGDKRFTKTEESIARRKEKQKEYSKNARQKAYEETGRKNKYYKSDYQRNYVVKRNYGITYEDKIAMYESQNKRCSCCGVYMQIYRDLTTKGSKNNVACLDHDHRYEEEFGVIKIRGLICSKCNSGIGILGDTADELYKRYVYLKKYEEKLTSK